MNIPLKCACGKLRGIAARAPEEAGLRVSCLCGDCQAYAHFLNRADVLDKSGGTDIVPMAPANITITQGRENLQCVRLSEKGMYRWYAGCCRTPISNSMASAKIPFTGVVHSILKPDAGTTLDELFGPVQMHVQAEHGIAPLPPHSHKGSPPRLIFSALGFLFRGLLKGRSQPSPFFGPDGKPAVVPRVLTPDVRAQLRELCGPNPNVANN